MRKIALFALSAAFLTGCGAVLKTEGPKKVDGLVANIEQVYVEAELCREKSAEAMDLLQVLAAQEFEDGDATKAYAEFVEALAASEKQAEMMRATIEPMKAAAKPVFKQWEDDLKAFSSENMREMSTERLSTTTERFDSIVQWAEKTQEKFDALNMGMKDHALFLHNDLNIAALDLIQDDVRDLVQLVSEIDEGYEETMTAARTYIDATALPLSAAAQRFEERVEASREAEEEKAEEKPEVRRVSARGRER
ncbi:MAG: DUF2959 family protein [Planctomycetota bacterium]